MDMRMERRVLTPMRSVDDLVDVLNSYTLAGEWGPAATPYFFCRNRDLGTISVYGGYSGVRCFTPICIYMVNIYIVSAN